VCSRMVRPIPHGPKPLLSETGCVLACHTGLQRAVQATNANSSRMRRMADDHDVHFESADAGASLTYPQQAGTIRKNGFIVIKNRPCKVSPVAVGAVLA
jgi:hypothetical protein